MMLGKKNGGKDDEGDGLEGRKCCEQKGGCRAGGAVPVAKFTKVVLRCHDRAAVNDAVAAEDHGGAVVGGQGVPAGNLRAAIQHDDPPGGQGGGGVAYGGLQDGVRNLGHRVPQRSGWLEVFGGEEAYSDVNGKWAPWPDQK